EFLLSGSVVVYPLLMSFSLERAGFWGENTARCINPIANDRTPEDSMSTQPTETNPIPTETHKVKLILEGQAGELLNWLQSVMAALQVHQKGPPGPRGAPPAPPPAPGIKPRAAPRAGPAPPAPPRR